jgi:protein involved in polysaccharide export with SLBB domain
MSTAWNGRTSMTCERMNRIARRIGPLLLLVWMLGAGPARAADPAPSETTRVRTIMAGDRLRITVLEAPEMNRVYAVAGDGTVDMELIGPRVRGGDGHGDGRPDDRGEAAGSPTSRRPPSRSTVSEFVEGSILILGAVTEPGAIPFKGDTLLTLVEAISMSGGLLPDNAAGNDVRILRLEAGRRHGARRS